MKKIAAGPGTSIGGAPAVTFATALAGATRAAGAARFWDENGVERRPPEDWRNTRMHFRLHLSHVWIMNGTFGLVVNVTDAKVVSEGGRGAQATWACPS